MLLKKSRTCTQKSKSPLHELEAFPQVLLLKNVKGNEEYFVTLKYRSELLVNVLVNFFTMNLS